MTDWTTYKNCMSEYALGMMRALRGARVKARTPWTFVEAKRTFASVYLTTTSFTDTILAKLAALVTV